MAYISYSLQERQAGETGERYVRLAFDIVTNQSSTLLSGESTDLDGNDGTLEFKQSVVQASTYYSPIGLLNFFLTDNVLAKLATSIKAKDSQRFAVQVALSGNFDHADYDPTVGLLLGQYASDSGDNLLLVKILVPVLVGTAILGIVATVLVAVVVRYVIWHRIYGGRGLVNFQGDDL